MTEGTDRPNRQRWVRVKDVLYQALDVSAEDRPALLDRECMGDPELRAEVSALLAADAVLAADPTSRSFLESGVDALAGRLLATAPIPAVADIDRVRQGADSSRIVNPRDVDRVPFAWGALEVRTHLGSGAFGDVYRAFDPVLRREVALKLRCLSLSGAPGAQEAERIDAHLEEARRLARVRHPNVLAVHGVETHEGFAGIWTDLVQGETLDRVLERSGPLSRESLARMGVDLCRALEAVHAAGMVHGDVKAANAMLDADGRTILMDFGSGNQSSSTSGDLEETGIGATRVVGAGADPGTGAHASAEASSSSRPVIQGTPVAMAPELFGGTAASIASDLYALGTLLYRLATGRYPFRGKSVGELLDALQQQDPVRLEEARPDLPAAFAQVVHRALSPFPEDRPSSAVELEWLLSASLGVIDAEIGRTRPGSQSGASDEPHREAADNTARANEKPAPEGSVPKMAGRFIGRKKELEQLRSLLTTPGWITVTGPGGSGKTHLTQRIVSEMATILPGGATWIDLAPITEENDVESSIARSLGLRDETRQSRLDQIVERLGGRSQLFVLDNAEQVSAAVVRVAELLVRSCPRLHLLATSRRTLGSAAERVFRLPPMSLPNDRGGKEGLEIVDADAVRLFLDRVQRVQRDFVLNAEMAPTIVRLVRMLDGIPLALELAAARVPVLGMNGLAARLESGMSALGTSGTRREARHRTIRASIQWSYDLLSPEQATLFAQLAAFSGGWTLEAAEGICGNEGSIGERAILDLLEELVELSLVAFDEQAGPNGRYRFHELVRKFATEALAMREDAEQVREAHLAWFQRASWNRGLEMNGPNALQAMAFFDGDYANLMAALDTAIGDAQRVREDPDRPLHLCVSVRTYWSQRGLYREGLRRTEGAISSDSIPSPAFVRVLCSISSFQTALGDLRTASLRATEAVETARAIADQKGLRLALLMLNQVRETSGDLIGSREVLEEVLALGGGDEPLNITLLCNLGVTTARMGDLDAARTRYLQAMAISQATGDQSSVGHIQGNLANIAWDRGEIEEARALAEDSIRTLRRASNRSSLWVGLRILVRVALARGDAAGARTALLEGLALAREADREGTLLHFLEEAADLALLRDRAADAAEILGYISADRESRRIEIDASQAAVWERRVDRVRAVLEDSVFAMAWAQGRVADRERVVALASGVNEA